MSPLKLLKTVQRQKPCQNFHFGCIKAKVNLFLPVRFSLKNKIKPQPPKSQMMSYSCPCSAPASAKSSTNSLQTFSCFPFGNVSHTQQLRWTEKLYQEYSHLYLNSHLHLLPFLFLTTFSPPLSLSFTFFIFYSPSFFYSLFFFLFSFPLFMFFFVSLLLFFFFSFFFFLSPFFQCFSISLSLYVFRFFSFFSVFSIYLFFFLIFSSFCLFSSSFISLPTLSFPFFFSFLS